MVKKSELLCLREPEESIAENDRASGRDRALFVEPDQCPSGGLLNRRVKNMNHHA
jgi:hypothetical protein